MTADLATALRQALNTITVTWDSMIPEGPKAITHGTTGRTDTHPTPIPVHTLDVIHETLARLNGWASVVIDGRDLNQPVSSTDAHALARLLRDHADWLAAHEAGEIAVVELSECARKIVAIAEPRGAREFFGPCGCGGDLRAFPGEPARCGYCGAKVDAETQQRAVLAKAANALMTVTEMLTLAPRMWDQPLNKMRVSRWVKAGRLTAAGTDLEGVALYRVGDVAALLAENGSRAA